MNRRNFIKNNSLLLGGLALSSAYPFSSIFTPPFKSQRPPVDKRSFSSKIVDETIEKIKPIIADPEIRWMFENCFPNTLDTTVDFEYIDGKPDTFIITGDIDAMWLRDSTAQVWPYLQLIDKDPHLKEMVKGLVNRQTKCVLKDPYANAFYKDLTKKSDHATDKPSPIPGVHERKWEIDSLCYVIRLANAYYQLTQDTSIFDDDWDKAMRLIYKTFRTEQRKNGKSPYEFIRVTDRMTDAPLFLGKGRPIRPTGMIVSSFRPSDDATLYSYLIPSNLFAVASLMQLNAIYKKHLDSEFANDCKNLAEEIKKGIRKYALQKHLDFGKIYAYEVDGFGNSLFCDDANVPSLMSLPYLGLVNKEDPIYKRTRQFLLSENNPYFLKGKVAEGQGSPHTGTESIWPMGIILRALTSIDDNEILKCLHMLKRTHAETGFMHESFHKDDAKNFSRSWFAWANTLFGELIFTLAKERPYLLKNKNI